MNTIPLAVAERRDDLHRGVEFDGKGKRNPDKPVILSSAAFTAGFTPPDYQLDGILQRRFVYSLTAPTGSGKTAILLRMAAHAALGDALGKHDMRQGRVVYFAGENPDDVRMRWIAMAEKMEFDLATIAVHFIPGTFAIPALDKRIREEAKSLGGFSLVIIDTSAAYFQGGDENSNTEMGKHARLLRSLTTMPGGPCVVVACHPVKNASMDNLLPRGGGAFIAEMYGNLVCMKRESVVDLHWQGKFRGPDFEALGFRLETVTADSLRDSLGRRIPAVVAHPISDADRSDMQAAETRDGDKLILLLAGGDFGSVSGTAEALGWFGRTGQPQKSKVHAALLKLKREGLAEKLRDRWKLTGKGKEEAARLKDTAPKTHWNSRSDA